ncbi:MAG TPA: Ppx/GppA phosphatase family protein [Vicinamibacterales bacterium]|nr:Ppx/GppA phosphatase family protein [Vicinamibacterales bacterium]
MRIAAIDIGTNSVHMIVCRIRPDLSFEVIDREKDMIRLGAGSLDGRALPASSLSAAMLTLAKYRRLAESHGVDEIIAAGTSAVREAENGADFIAAVHRDVGIRVRVISGTEEARLIHLAAAYAVGVGRRAAVVLDIGGGSTEITLGTASRVQMGRSFKLGVIRLAERFAKSDPLSGRDERRLERHVQRETRAYLRQVRRRGFQRVIGTSGTILSLGALALGAKRPPSDVRNVRVSAKALGRLRKRLTAMRLDDRLKLSGLDPRRADLAAPGIVLLDTLLTGLGATELTLCDFALREGLVLDYVQKNASHIRSVERYPDVRRRSVMELAERCGYRAAHARQVARLALKVFDLTRESHGLGPREREWLEYGALLHDIGIHISYERHHKHSYYLIKNGDLRGFDPEEIEIIALVARYHRQAEPKKGHEGFADLPGPARRTVRVLGAIVRLAEGLDRSHAQVITGVDASPNGPGIKLRLQSSGDAELELWAADRHASALAKLFEQEIHFELIGAAPRAPKDTTAHAQHAHHAAQLPRQVVRRRGHRRIGQDHAARPARQVAHGERPSRVRH